MSRERRCVLARSLEASTGRRASGPTIRPWLVCLALALSLAALGPADAQHRRRHAKNSTKKVGQLRQDLAVIRHKKANLRKQIRQTKHQANVVLADIGNVDNKLENIQGQLEDTKDRLSTSQSQQRRLGQELVVATDELGTVCARHRHGRILPT